MDARSVRPSTLDMFGNACIQYWTSFSWYDDDESLIDKLILIWGNRRIFDHCYNLLYVVYFEAPISVSKSA